MKFLFYKTRTYCTLHVVCTTCTIVYAWAHANTCK